jgi:hypothetical protein
MKTTKAKRAFHGHFSNQTIFERCVIKDKCKNGYQKDMCLNEIGLSVQKMLSILGSIINIIGGKLCDHLMSLRIFTLTMNKIFMRVSKLTGKWLRTQSGINNHLMLIACFATYSK